VKVVREILLLLGPKWRSTRRRGAGARGRAGRVLLLLGVGAAAWPFVYFTLVRFLNALRGVEDVGPLLAARLLTLGLLIFLGILLLSNVIAALSSFFLARDLPAIRSTPVDGLSLYLARLSETLVSSSWMVALLLVPALAAYGRAYGAGPGFAFVAIAGVVGWVGLVIPHVARMLVGPGFGRLLPVAVLLGALYMLVVDTLARTVGSTEVPLGILTAAIGAPFFLWLLARGRRSWS